MSGEGDIVLRNTNTSTSEISVYNNTLFKIET